jgi:hypothetical protein
MLLCPPAAASDVAVVVGPVVSLPSGAPVATDSLSLAACVAPALAPAETARVGTLVFEVRIQRRKVSLVSLVTADAPVAELGACLQRELAAYAWPVRQGRLQVPVTIEK